MCITERSFTRRTNKFWFHHGALRHGKARHARVVGAALAMALRKGLPQSRKGPSRRQPWKSQTHTNRISSGSYAIQQNGNIHAQHHSKSIIKCNWVDYIIFLIDYLWRKKDMCVAERSVTRVAVRVCLPHGMRRQGKARHARVPGGAMENGATERSATERCVTERSKTRAAMEIPRTYKYNIKWIRYNSTNGNTYAQYHNKFNNNWVNVTIHFIIHVWRKQKCASRKGRSREWPWESASITERSGRERSATQELSEPLW